MDGFVLLCVRFRPIGDSVQIVILRVLQKYAPASPNISPKYY